MTSTSTIFDKEGNVAYSFFIEDGKAADNDKSCEPETIEEHGTAFDPVTRPEHYANSRIEVIDYIEDKQLGFCLGNVVKYVSRAGKKHSQGKTDLEKELEDLEKAMWYLNRRIWELKEGVNL